MSETGNLTPLGSLQDAEAAAPAPAPARATRLPFAQKLGYSAGQLVELVVASMLNIFALFYATGVCGLPGTLAGIALGAGLIVDAVMDPLIGSLSDGWKSRFGRRVPFMVVGLIPLLLSFNLIFALPATLSVTALFISLMGLSVLLRVSLSIFALPYQALGAELSDDYGERSSIAAWRWGVGILGTAAVIGLGYGVFLSGPDGIARRDAYLPLTLSLSVIIVLGGFIAIQTGLATRNLQREAPAPTEKVHHRLLGEMAEMLRNPTFRTLFGASLLFNVGQGLNQSLSLHVGIFFWGIGAAEMQVLALSAVMGLAVAAPLAVPLTSLIEKRTMLVLSLVGLALFHGVPPVLKVVGAFDVSGAALTGALAAFSFFACLTFAMSIIAVLAMIPDAADEHEHMFGARREGLYFAGWLFTSKAAVGAGLLFAGVALQLIQFPTDMSHSGVSAAGIPEQTLAWLALAGGPGSALFALLGAALVLFYRVDRKTHARIMADLVARRGA